MPFSDLDRAWERAQNNGRKSIPFSEIDPTFRIWPNRHGILLPYLDALQLDLERHPWADE
jgi:hypothetical protein